jgi:hypothetical protein
VAEVTVLLGTVELDNFIVSMTNHPYGFRNAVYGIRIPCKMVAQRWGKSRNISFTFFQIILKAMDFEVITPFLNKPL